MLKPHWHCRPFGEDGFVFIAVDQMLPNGTLVGLRHAVHPFMLDEAVDPRAVVMSIVEELTVTMERATCPLLQVDAATGEVSMVRAQPGIASRACAFGGAPCC